MSSKTQLVTQKGETEYSPIDLVLCARNREEVEKDMETQRVVFQSHRLNIWRTKTEYLPSPTNDTETTVKIVDAELPTVTSFKCLGSLVTSEGGSQADVNNMIIIGWKEVSGVGRQCQWITLSRDLSSSTLHCKMSDGGCQLSLSLVSRRLPKPSDIFLLIDLQQRVKLLNFHTTLLCISELGECVVQCTSDTLQYPVAIVSKCHDVFLPALEKHPTVITN